MASTVAPAKAKKGGKIVAHFFNSEPVAAMMMTTAPVSIGSNTTCSDNGTSAAKNVCHHAGPQAAPSTDDG